jgi:hypothetical protein
MPRLAALTGASEDSEWSLLAGRLRRPAGRGRPLHGGRPRRQHLDQLLARGRPRPARAHRPHDRRRPAPSNQPPPHAVRPRPPLADVVATAPGVRHHQPQPPRRRVQADVRQAPALVERRGQPVARTASRPARQPWIDTTPGPAVTTTRSMGRSPPRPRVTLGSLRTTRPSCEVTGHGHHRDHPC